MARQRTILSSSFAAIVLVTAACSSGDDDSGGAAGDDGTTAARRRSTTTSAASGVSDVDPTLPFPADRCAANQAAGTITYLSSFDYAAAASIVEVIVAEQKGYFDALCLDVEMAASFSTANYPLISANEAQFSSGGSFSEVLDFGAKNEADLVVLAVEGHTAIDALITKDGEIESLADVRGSTIGVKGKISTSVAAMLAAEGLIEGTDYQTVLIDGFDPKVHIELPGIIGFPGYKSNEPGQLERAGIPFQLWDPSEHDIPGSFGVLYTNQQFLDAHPTAAMDFMRAAMLGLQDALADPQAAADMALELINGNGNPNFLSPEGEVFRWKTEAELDQGHDRRRASRTASPTPCRCRPKSTRTRRSGCSAATPHRRSTAWPIRWWAMSTPTTIAP